MVRCPYCGRKLTINERYCHFCEQDLSKIVDEAEKPKVKKPDISLKEKAKKIKDETNNLKTVIKSISRNLKRKLRLNAKK